MTKKNKREEMLLSCSVFQSAVLQSFSPAVLQFAVLSPESITRNSEPLQQKNALCDLA